jgi:hypothetical protein
VNEVSRELRGAEAILNCRRRDLRGPKFAACWPLTPRRRSVKRIFHL